MDHGEAPDLSTESAMDAQLVAEALAGNAAATTSLIDRYYDLVRSYVSHLVDQDPVYQDLVHDVFLTMITQLDTLREPRCFAPWIKAISWRRCRAWVRSRQMQRRALPAVTAAWMPSPVQVDPSEAIHDDPWLARLERAIECMGEPRKVVLSLFYVEGLPIDRISAFLEIPAGTVKRRLFDSRLDLAKAVPSPASMHREERQRLATAITRLLGRYAAPGSPASPSTMPQPPLPEPS